jgi:hypothetical protein
MSLDVSRLEQVRQRGDKTIARCPACAEKGYDKKGEHLVIMADGRFGCVLHPGEEGEGHRRRIFALVGGGYSGESRGSGIRVRRPPEAFLSPDERP